MLNIVFFTFNAFEENTYLIINDKKQCWIVDPGMYGPQEVAKLTAYIAGKQLQPQAIVNTHAHIDHILGIPALKELYNIPFGMHELEVPVLRMAETSAAVFGFEFKNVPRPDFFIKDNEPLTLGEDTVDVFHTPGHSTGSISFYYPKGNWVISGDVLFSDSIGRTDLPGGNFDTLIHSVKTKLLTLPPDTKVLPGHGPETFIRQEKLHNPFLQ